MIPNHNSIINYYQNIESRLGYDLLLGGTKHFGYYPTAKGGIPEKQALINLQDLVAQNLDIKSNQTVLDAGCGQGIVGNYLAKKYNANITGITIVPFEAQKANKLAHKLGISDRINFSVMDYSQTTFPDNNFNAIYTTESLSHSPNVFKTLTEFYRILKPNGKIALFEYTIAPIEQFSPHEKKMLDIVLKGTGMQGLPQIRHDEFPGLIRKVGFQNVTQQNITLHMGPSFLRLHRLSFLPYQLIRLLHLQKYFINTTAAYEYYKMAKKGLFRYCIFTGNK